MLERLAAHVLTPGRPGTVSGEDPGQPVAEIVPGVTYGPGESLRVPYLDLVYGPYDLGLYTDARALAQTIGDQDSALLIGNDLDRVRGETKHLMACAGSGSGQLSETRLDILPGLLGVEREGVGLGLNQDEGRSVASPTKGCRERDSSLLVHLIQVAPEVAAQFAPLSGRKESFPTVLHFSPLRPILQVTPLSRNPGVPRQNGDAKDPAGHVVPPGLAAWSGPGGPRKSRLSQGQAHPPQFFRMICS